jgi:hypothetical protein
MSTVIAKPAPAPQVFRDSLSLRARNLRFRGIGNPYTFLEEIGLVPIKEYIYRGATIIDLADELNLPVTTIRTWIEENGYQGELEEAGTLSAEGYIRQGEIMLKNATDKFQLDKAKATIEHGRWMASKKDKKTYGQSATETQQQAAVSYTFLIGDGAAVQINQDRATKPADPKSINTEDSTAPPVTFSLDQTNPFTLDRIPDYLQKTHSDFPVIAPVKPIEGDLDL